MPKTFSATIKSRRLWGFIALIYLAFSWCAILWLPSTLNRNSTNHQTEQCEECVNPPSENKTQVNRPAEYNHTHPRDWVDFTVIAGGFLTGVLLFWQGWLLFATVRDGRNSLLNIVIENKNWYREFTELGSQDGYKKIEITATVRNASSKACIIEAIEAEVRIERVWIKEKPLFQNHPLYQTRVIEPGHSFDFACVSIAPYHTSEREAIRITSHAMFKAEIDGKPPVFKRAYFWGGIKYKSLFDEIFYKAFFGTVDWDEAGVPHFKDGYEKYNYTKKLSPTLRSRWMNFMFKRKWAMWLYQRYVETKAFFFPYRPPWQHGNQ